MCLLWHCLGVQAVDPKAPETGLMTAEDFVKATPGNHHDPLKAWRPMRVSRVQNQAAQGTEDQTEGFHHIPGLTIDSPAIARVKGASLKECVEACNKVHLCTGVQFSEDTKLEGGNCLIMERRVQFSETFDYYERPGISDQKVKQMDQEMQHRWEADEHSELGSGLSPQDIPGAVPVHAGQEEEESKKYIALEKAAAVIKQMNEETANRKQAQLNDIHKQLIKKQKEFDSTRSLATKLGEQVEASEKKAANLASESEKEQLDNAKLTLEVSRMSKKSRQAITDLGEAEQKTREYKQAHDAYRMAGNPLAQQMGAKFHHWQKALKVRKMALLEYRQKRLKLKALAAGQSAKSRELEQEANWAKIDHDDLIKRHAAAEKLHQMSRDVVHQLRNQLKSITPGFDQNDAKRYGIVEQS